MITEIVTFQLNEGADLADASSPASATIRDAIASDLAAYGAHDFYFASFVEKPDVGILVFEWDSEDTFRKFLGSDDFAPHLKHWQPLVRTGTRATILHVEFGPAGAEDPLAALGADGRVGLTEVLFSYFPTDLSAGGRAAVMAAVELMRPVITRSESLAAFDGWALETEVPCPKQGGEGEPELCQVWVSLVGWVDLAAHMRMRASEDFQQNIHHLLGVKDMRHSEYMHAKFHAV